MDYQTGEYLLRLPLPLCSYVGVLVTQAVYQTVSKTIENLRMIKESVSGDHRAQVQELLKDTVLPIQMKHAESLLLIAREDIDFAYELTK